MRSRADTRRVSERTRLVDWGSRACAAVMLIAFAGTKLGSGYHSDYHLPEFAFWSATIVEVALAYALVSDSMAGLGLWGTLAFCAGGAVVGIVMGPEASCGCVDALGIPPRQKLTLLLALAALASTGLHTRSRVRALHPSASTASES